MASMFPCECEHKAHMERDARTPNGNPGHTYQQGFAFRALLAVSTPYGTFAVCLDCAGDCYAMYPKATR